MDTDNTILIDSVLKAYIPEQAKKVYDFDSEAIYIIENEGNTVYLSYEYPLLVHYIRCFKGGKSDRRLDSIKLEDKEHIELIKLYLSEG